LCRRIAEVRSLLKRLKLLVLSAMTRSGLSALLLNSRWRSNRLLILGYHGFSQDDEHLWNSSLYMPAAVFRSRLSHLRDNGCNVLSLADALRRLYSGTLPERSVVLTIDDGTYDAYRLAFPIIQHFGYPATVYLTTYYCDFQRPVFDVMASYLLWKARGRTTTLPGICPHPIFLDDKGRDSANRLIKLFAQKHGLSGREKDILLTQVAARLELDYEALCRKRMLYIMTHEEARELAQAGFDIQLHTHRHRLSRRRNRMLQEVVENERRITALRESPARHFCYPGGVYLPEFELALAECGIESAVTCWPGFATGRTGPLRLPRLLDSIRFERLEFAGWVSGEASLLPRRKFIAGEGQMVE